MEMLPKIACLMPLLFATQVHGGCRNANWWRTFNRGGLSRCSSMSNEYIRGFFRNNQGSPDVINLLEEAVCCTPPGEFAGDETQVFYGYWWGNFDHNNRWNVCPTGTFLHGLYRTGQASYLWNIEEGRCMKPASHPYRYGHCYEQDVSSSFDHRGTSQCRQNYFIAGLYRGGCPQLKCIERFRCCKMAPAINTVTSLDTAKTKVMDNTMSDMAFLAHYLGYGWCGGCRGSYIGEDFYRDGTKWVSKTRGPCPGYMSNIRLSMDYADWKFSLKDVVFGGAVLQDLRPEFMDGSAFTNELGDEVEHEFAESITTTRTVSHTTTSEWRQTEESGFSVGFTPGLFPGFTANYNYNFAYETSTATTDSTGNEQTRTLNARQTVTVLPYETVNFTLAVYKTRRTVPYTAKVMIDFSTEFQGFLRWGGGYNGQHTNYHRDHRGSGARPRVNFRFGGPNMSFAQDLKHQSDILQHPWQWSDLRGRYSHAQNLIDSLVNEGRYEFTITGKFDEILGKRLQIIVSQPWTRRKRDVSRSQPVQDAARAGARGPVPTVEHHNAAVKNIVATEKPGDPPGVFPPPPHVELDPVVKFIKPTDLPKMGD